MPSKLARVSILVILSALWVLQPVDIASQAEQAAERARGHSARHLDDLAAKHGRNGTSYRELRLQFDERGRAHRKVQQLYRGVPVFGGEAIVHTEADGTLEAITDDYVTGVGPVDTVPVLTPEDAINAALAAYGADASVLTGAPRVDLWILRQGGDHLAYRVRLRREDGTDKTALPIYFIDAADGTVLFGYNNLQTQSTTGQGTSIYSGNVSITTYQDGSTYYLQDVDRKIGTFTMGNTTSTVNAVTDDDNNFDSAVQKAAVDAQYGATKTFDYYLNVHGRAGINDNRGPGDRLSADGVTRLLTNRVHYSTNYCNAFWNSINMTYGDGDLTQGCHPVVSIDVTGHEMTHGVIEKTANLTYSGESGGLNESFADIFGAMTERYARGMSPNVWLMGEEVIPPFLRSMKNPPLDGASPDHWSSGIGGMDVHYSSGPQNKAFYLLSDGGTHPFTHVTVTGIGADKAEKIFYKALTTYMTASTNYAGARTATLNAAAALYGNHSNEYVATATAWCAINVGACPVPDVTAPITTATAGAYTFGSWTNQDVTITLAAADEADGSGVDSLVYSASGATSLPATTTGGNATITLTADGETIISFHATDVAGNIEATQTRVVRIDHSAPVTIASAAGYSFGSWTNHSVTVALDAADNADGSGVASLVYFASGATTLPPTTTGGNAVITVNADGETIISFHATDVAGNIETTQTRVVRIDHSGPSATVAASPTALWPPNGKPVAVTISGAVQDPAGVVSASYIVDDEYGQASSSGAVAVAADGSYQFTIQLPASRLGTDSDGRVFRIRIVTTDAAGNTSTVEARVIVPHSQGK